MSRLSIWDILAGHKPPAAPKDNWHRVQSRRFIDSMTDSIMASEPDSLELDEIPRRPMELEDLEIDGESLDMVHEGQQNEWPIDGVTKRAPGPLAPDAEMPTLRAPPKGRRKRR